MNKSFSNPTPSSAPADLLEELQGDLHEQFAHRANQVGSCRAVGGIAWKP